MSLSNKLKTFFLILTLFSHNVKGSSDPTDVSNTISVGGSFQDDDQDTTVSTPDNIAIGPEDIISVKNRHLVKADGTKFLLKGIAFPDPPPSSSYDAKAWIAILHQLRDLNLQYNAVRIYRMDPYTDYSEFINEAARLGVYVLVPLTSAQGSGVIDRDASPMKCYPHSTFEYGVSSLKNYLRYPNVIAGLLGNEVMNSPQTWSSAPCVKAYGRDLRLWMSQEVEKGTIARTLPLVYAAQNTGIGPMVGPADAMQMTMDYMTCITDEEVWKRREEERQKRMVSAADDDDDDGGGTSQPSSKEIEEDSSEEDFEDDGGTAIDIFGINVESWCSSYDTYETNVDDTPGTYHTLHEGLKDASIPLIFSEMGCAHDLYDGDLDDDDDDDDKDDDKDEKNNAKLFPPDLENAEGPKRKEGDRTWGQVPVVLNEMSDIWAGFFAYAYDGSPQFVMFDDGPWDGKNPLEPTADFYSFKEQLDKVAAMAKNSSSAAHNSFEDDEVLPPLCHMIEKELQERCGIEIENFRNIPTRVGREFPKVVEYIGIGLMGVILVVYGLRLWRMRRRRMVRKQYEMII